MDYSSAVFFLEILGTIAFASSGAYLGIQKKLDIFGVNVLGVTTAVGGGLIRDLILGRIPPGMFRDPRYTMAAVVTSTVLFILIYRHGEMAGPVKLWYNRIIAVMDMIGLGIFTVLGMNTAIEMGYYDRRFLIVFVGVLTGVGGGLLRDMMVSVTPYIFVKHIYAIASLIGALAALLLRPYLPWFICMIVGALLVMVIRILAAHYQWNLPRIR